MRKSYTLILAAALLMAGGYRLFDWWQSRGLITIDVTDVELQPMLREVARQGRVPVLVSTNASGKVSLHVNRVTMEAALEMLADQVEGSWRPVYFVGKDHGQIEKLQEHVREKGPPFLITKSYGEGGPFLQGVLPPSIHEPVVLTIPPGQNIQTAFLQLALQQQTSIVVEESLSSTLTLGTIQTPGMTPMVRRMAKAVGAREEWVYYFRVMGRGRSRDRSQAGEDPVEAEKRRQVRDAERQAQMDRQLALLPKAEQDRILDRMDEADQAREEISRLSGDQRLQKMEQTAHHPKGQERFEKRNQNNIKNQSPEQRVKRYQRMAARQKKQEQQSSSGKK